MNKEEIDESILFNGNDQLTVDEFIKILSQNSDKYIYADTGEEVNLFNIQPYEEQDGTVILQADQSNDEDITCEEVMERLLLDVRRGSISRNNAMKFAYGDLFDDKDAYIADLEEIYENDGAMFVKFKSNENANLQLENENESINEQQNFDLQKAFDRYNNATEDQRFEVDDIADKFTEDANKILDKNDPELHGSFLQYADGFEIQDAYVNANKNIQKFIDQQYPWMKEPFENAPVESKIEKLYVLLDDQTLPAIVLSYCPQFNEK